MKEVIDVINMVITQVKEYNKVLKGTEKLKGSGDKLRFYKIKNQRSFIMKIILFKIY